MSKVLACIAGQHDLRLLLIAACVCLFGCFIALNLLSRAGGRYNPQFLIWIVFASLVGGSAVWSAHFIAMLAFHPGVPVGYDPPLIILSLLLAIATIGAGWTLSLIFPKWAPLASGISGVGIGAMHFTGMAGVKLAATLHYNDTYVASAIAISVIFSALAMVGFHPSAQQSARSLMVRTIILAAAIAGLHLVSMAALTITPNPTLLVAATPSGWLAAIITLAIVLILGLSFAGVTTDRHLSSRTALETIRLREHVAELQETKLTLERTTKELEDALEASAAASDAKSKFLAAMSHELRTPLNAVIGFSEIMSGEMFGPLGSQRYHDYVQNIRTSGLHLLELINEVLDYSKLEAEQLELNEEVVDPRLLLRESMEIMRAAVEKSGHHLILDAQSDLPDILIDRRRMRQVMLNLLSNAVKFSLGGSTIRVCAYQRSEGVEISVTDAGVGIARADIPRALELFGQVDTSLARRYEGTGLGLPLAKRLVELHDGTLEIDSILGTGTTIRILIPSSRLCAIEAVA